MTDLVFLENGPTRTGERAARREVIDFMAARMAFQKGRNWQRMTEARREQMRTQARTSLIALRQCIRHVSEAESFIAVGASMAINDGTDGHTIATHADAYISEVLK